LACVVANQVTSDLLRTIDVDLTRRSRADEDISVNGGAVGVLGGIGLGVDGGSGLRANGSSLGSCDAEDREGGKKLLGEHIDLNYDVTVTFPSVFVDEATTDKASQPLFLLDR